MIGLAVRLMANGGRESLVRLVLTALGEALAVVLLLSAAVVYPALQAHDERRAWLDTSVDNQQPAQDESTTDPLLWRLNELRYEDDDLVRVDLAARGPDAPVPPGLEELPGPGELAVSPRLAELMEQADPATLGERFPGQIAAVVGADALASPDDLVVFVGRSSTELANEDDVITVHSIESLAVEHHLTRGARIGLVIGGVGLLAPIVVFVATATRLAAARRERRLAALRLTGATPRQVALMAGVESAMASVAGVLAGFATFFAIRSRLAEVPIDGAAFYPSDLQLSLAWSAVVGLGVPLLSVGAAILSLRQVRVSPLGVVGHSSRSRATPRPLILVATGLALLGLVINRFSNGSGDTATVSVLVGAAFLMTILGVVLTGPWLTSLVGRVIVRFGSRAPALLAGRRLQDNPAAGFRSISGIVVAVFVGTVVAVMAASTLVTEGTDENGLADGVVAIAPLPDEPTEPVPPRDQLPNVLIEPRPELEPRVADRLIEDVESLDGVNQVTTAHAVPDDPEVLEQIEAVADDRFIGPAVMSCADASTAGLSSGCEGVAVVSAAGRNIQATGIELPAGVFGDLDGLPVVAVAAATDGDAASVEAARTQIERWFPGAAALTGEDIEDLQQDQTRTYARAVNLALAVTLIIAGCSLAVTVAGAIVERRQPLALLRLAGTRLGTLNRMVLAEAAAPLLIVTAASVLLGMLVSEMLLSVSGRQQLALPGLEYWLALGAGLGVGLLIVSATLPLLARLTALEANRFE